MSKFLPQNWRSRAVSAAVSGACALAFFGLLAHGALAWGTATLWVFVLGIGALAFALQGRVD